MEKELTASVVPCSARPLKFDESLCVGCNRCADVCQVDIMIPNPVRGKHPLVIYPGECYYCGSCVMACPNKGAISLEHPADEPGEVRTGEIGSPAAVPFHLSGLFQISAGNSRERGEYMEKEKGGQLKDFSLSGRS